MNIAEEILAGCIAVTFIAFVPTCLLWRVYLPQHGGRRIDTSTAAVVFSLGAVSSVACVMCLLMLFKSVSSFAFIVTQHPSYIADVISLLVLIGDLSVLLFVEMRKTNGSLGSVVADVSRGGCGKGTGPNNE